MKIALDIQLTLGTATGIGEYARGLADALRAQGIDVAELSEPKLDPWRFDRRFWWDQFVLPRRARESGAQLLHCASGTMPSKAGMPVAVTVHDVAWLKVQQHTRRYARFYFGKFSLRRYRGARAVLVDSQFSKGELLSAGDIDASRVFVVYPGVARDYCELQRRPSADPYILAAGTVEPRKNLEVLVRALARVRGVRLVSAGPSTPYRRECEELAQRLGVGDRVTFLGYVTRSQLLDMYASCSLVAVPSRYEGFGYAAAQALCAGTPVLVAQTSSLPEVVRSDAAALSVDDDVAWALAIKDILRSPDAAEARAAQARSAAIERFAWASSARAAIGAYEYALS